METHAVNMAEHLSQLVLQLGIIIFAAWLGGRIFSRFKLPSVLGEIIAGVVIGPYALGQIAFPGLEHGLFPIYGAFPVSIELYSLATIASIILLFLVGLETDIDTFLRFSVAGSVVGIFGVLVSFFSGAYVAVLMGPMLLGHPIALFDPIAMFMGVISTATSVGISARILSQHRKMDSPEGVTILSAAVIDDVLGIIILAIVVGTAKSSHLDLKEVLFISGKAIGVWLGFTILGLACSKYIGRLLKVVRSRETIAIFSLSFAFILAAIFERSGLAMIIGAYVMGLSLSKTDLALMIQDKLGVLVKFFVPIFFCVMGMLINLEEMLSWNIQVVGFVYIIFAVVGKLVGCGLPALFLNFNMRGAMRIGVGMIPRGEVALIVAGIGLANGIIGDEVFSVAIIMTFITTLLTPPILDRMLRNNKPVLRKEDENKKEHKVIDYEMPNHQTAELILGKIISAFDGEGFFIHRTDIPERVYHMRKNETFIMLKYTPQNLNFYCSENDEAFIRTLFYEVIAEFKQIVKNVQSYTVDPQAGKDIFDVEVKLNGKSKIKFYELISPLAIEVDLKGNTKTEIVKEMVALLVRAGQIPFPKIDEIYSEVMKREETMSTGMQDGIALPHAKSKQVDRMHIAIGIKKDGVDFDAFDEKPCQIFVLTIAPSNKTDFYLQAIADLSRFLSEESSRQRILSAKNNTRLYDVIMDIM